MRMIENRRAPGAQDCATVLDRAVAVMNAVRMGIAGRVGALTVAFGVVAGCGSGSSSGSSPSDGGASDAVSPFDATSDSPSGDAPSDSFRSGSDGGIDASADAGSDVSTDAQSTDAPSFIDAPPGTIPPGAVLWLKMDNDPTNGAIDSAGSHLTTCTSCPALVPGQFGSAYQFDGASNEMVVAPAADLEPGAGFTFAAWVRVDSPPVGAVVSVGCKDQGSLDCSYALFVNTMHLMNQPDFYTVGSSHLLGPTPLAIGAWHHMALTFDGNNKVGYFDGAATGQASVGALVSDTGNGITLGARAASPPLFFAGTIDDLVLYDRVLSTAEIGQLARP
jgi:hypothetical protein